MAAAMVQDEPITPEEMLVELSPTASAFSVTGVIGGKLRALYDDTAQPSPTCLTGLLRALDTDRTVD